MAEKKMPIPGQNVGEPTEEELKNEMQRIVEEKRSIIADLNKIKYPLSATLFTHNGTWTIRNVAFWKALNKRDEDIIKFMEQYLIEKK